jgi:hypothetical protein
MSFNDQLFLVIPRRSLKRNLHRFCFKPHTENISHLYIKPEEDRNHFRYGENLLDFVNREGHLSHQKDTFIANITVGFQNSQHNETGKLYLIYREEQQYLFNLNLDLAVLWVDTQQGLPELLFSKTYRPIFNSLIDQLEVVWGFNRDYPNAGPYPYEYKDKVWLKSPARKHIDLWSSQVLILGEFLVDYFGINTLRQTQSFVRWEIGKQKTFVFISPYLYYLYPDLYKNQNFFSRQELKVTEDYLDKQLDPIALEAKNEKALNDALHLPLSILYSKLNISLGTDKLG